MKKAINSMEDVTDTSSNKNGKRKLSREEYENKHEGCFHKCVRIIEKNKMKGCQCEDCYVECYYSGRGVYCLTFREICGDAPFSPMSWGDESPDKIKVQRPIVKHVCKEQ